MLYLKASLELGLKRVFSLTMKYLKQYGTNDLNLLNDLISNSNKHSFLTIEEIDELTDIFHNIYHNILFTCIYITLYYYYYIFLFFPFFFSFYLFLCIVKDNISLETLDDIILSDYTVFSEHECLYAIGRQFSQLQTITNNNNNNNNNPNNNNNNNNNNECEDIIDKDEEDKISELLNHIQWNRVNYQFFLLSIVPKLPKNLNIYRYLYNIENSVVIESHDRRYEGFPAIDRSEIDERFDEVNCNEHSNINLTSIYISIIIYYFNY